MVWPCHQEQSLACPDHIVGIVLFSIISRRDRWRMEMSSVIRIELLQEVHSAVVTQKRRADRDALCCLLSKSGKKARGSSHPCMRDHHRPQRIILLRKMLKEGSDIVDAMEEIGYLG
eukprot:scaffold4020_cov276-Ochromonas_danica.AAC.2